MGPSDRAAVGKVAHNIMPSILTVCVPLSGLKLNSHEKRSCIVIIIIIILIFVNYFGLLIT